MRKRELCVLTRDHENSALMQYKSYCKILTKVILEAKRCSYNESIINSQNIIKTTWNLINKTTGKVREVTNANKINPNTSNNYFLNVANTISCDLNTQNMTDSDNLNFQYYLKQAFKVSFPKISYKNISTNEIEKTIS
jgi:hypothetical protein